MRKISFLIGLCIIIALSLLAACDKGCKIKYPKDVKPIDWENYNDVYTVYWNTVHPCSDLCNHPEDFWNYQCDTIKISGWKAWGYDYFYLCDDAKYAIRDLGYTAPFPMMRIRCNLPSFKDKLDTCDLTKKCFIKGILVFESVGEPRCGNHGAHILITDINDIYFE
jgi:hypothetical protein